MTAKAALARQVARRLRVSLGAPEPPPKRPVLDELVNTILSQNTSDRNRDRAFAALKGRYPSWEHVLRAPIGELQRTISTAGLAPTKSRRIRVILEQVYRDGAFDPEAIGRMPKEKALSVLTSLDGVGPKTAACVLLFSCGVPVFPVDTHIHRAAGRLGLLPPGADRVRAHDVLAGLFRPREYLGVHLNLIRLGRTLCRPQRPRCPECPLRDICRTGRPRVDIPVGG